MRWNFVRMIILGVVLVPAALVMHQLIGIKTIPFAKLTSACLICGMTAQTVIKQFKALPRKQRAEVAKFVVESLHD